VRPVTSIIAELTRVGPRSLTPWRSRQRHQLRFRIASSESRA